MTPDDVYTFLALVRSYYPTFHSLSSTQRALWTADLADYRNDTAHEGLRRWVRWHRQTPPELAEIVRSCKEVAHEAARWRSPAEALPLVRSPEQGMVLKSMAHIIQRLLGPCQDDTGQVYPRLSLAEVPALLHTLSAAHRDRPELAHEFAVLSTKFAAMDDGEDTVVGEE